jgi:hypothetical protein
MLRRAGLIFAHTFLRRAIHDGKVDHPHRLMAGRLTVGDVMALEPWFRSGSIAGPAVEAPWVTDRHCLAAYLSRSNLASRISPSDVEFELLPRSER